MAHGEGKNARTKTKDENGQTQIADGEAAGWLPKALSAAERCISHDPEWTKGYFRRGEVFMGMCNYACAIDDYRKAMSTLESSQESDRELLEAKLHSAEDALHALADMKAIEEDLLGKKTDPSNPGESGKSVEELSMAAEDRDRDPETKLALERAAKDVASGQTDSALANLRHALRLEPSCYQASLQCGMILAKRGDNAGALDYFQQAMKSQPGCLAAYIMASQVLERMGRFSEAENVLKSVVASAFDYPEGWSALSMNLHRQGKLVEAVDLLKYAMTGGPYAKFKKPSKDSMVQFCLGLFKALLGYIAEPATLFIQICQKEPSPTTLFMMLRTCLMVKDYQLAESALSQICLAYDASPAAFVSEMVVFNSTFDLPHWTDLSTNKAFIEQCLNSEDDFFPETYSIPEEFAQLTSGEGRVKDKVWLIRGDSPKVTKVVRDGEDLNRELFAFESGLVQRYIGDTLLYQSRRFSLQCYIVISSYEPLEVEYNTELCGIVSKEEYNRDSDLDSDGCLPRLETGEVISSSELFHWLERSGDGKDANQPPVDVVKLKENLQQTIESTVRSLTAHFGQCKNEARPARYSAIGLPKIIVAEFIVDSQLKAWLTKVNSNPSLKHHNPIGKASINALSQTVLKGFGDKLFVTSESDSTLQGTIHNSALYRDYEGCKHSFRLLH